jgi:predicted PurR-regulated permease PerM
MKKISQDFVKCVILTEALSIRCIMHSPSAFSFSSSAPFRAPTLKQLFIAIIVAVVVGVLLWRLSPILSPFLLSIILAYILQPGVTWLSRHKVPCGIAALSMIFFLLFVIISLAVLLLVIIQEEAPPLEQQLSQLLERTQDIFGPRLARVGLAPRFNLSKFETFITQHLDGSANTLLLGVWTWIRNSSNMMIGIISRIFMVPLVLYYLLYDWEKLVKRLQALIPRRWLKKTLSLAGEVDKMLSKYLRGQLLVIGALAAYYSASLSIIGFELALPIGIFTGLAVIIPYIGYGIGLMLALGIAALQFGHWWAVGGVALIYIVGQVLESLFLTPRFIGERIGLHPLGVIFALLAFGQLFGFFGVLLALPASAILVIAMRELYQQYLASTFYKK